MKLAALVRARRAGQEVPKVAPAPTVVRVAVENLATRVQQATVPQFIIISPPTRERMIYDPDKGNRWVQRARMERKRCRGQKPVYKGHRRLNAGKKSRW